MGRGLLTAAFVVAALGAAARADGVIAPARAVVNPVRTPDQRALLRFDGATETLVIETTLQGDGHDFAWIVPLPAKPTIEASTTGLFPTLEYVTSPEIVDDRFEWKTVGDHFAWIYVAAGAVGLWAAVRWRRTLPRVVVFSIVPALLALVYSQVGLPGIPALKGGGGPYVGVTVLARERVGAFDTATLDARDAAGLRSWLLANGFRVPDGIDAVAEDYARAGWVFVASKIRRDADDADVRRIHPLAFTFPTHEAVYPMRLTGAANDSLALDLFVVGDKRAESEGLEVECCDGEKLAQFDDDYGDWTAAVGKFGRVQERGEFWKRCVGARVLTKLSGTLDRGAMSRDLHIRWAEYRPQRIRYVADSVAWDRSKLPGACAFAAAMLVAALVGLRRDVGVRWMTMRDAVAVAGALLVSGATATVSWWNEPRLPANVFAAGRGDWIPDEEMSPPFETLGDETAVRAWMTERMKGVKNKATGEPAREEDSPGNWGLRQHGGRLELLIDRYPWGARAMDVSRRIRIEGTLRTADGTPVPDQYVFVWEVVRNESLDGTSTEARTDSVGRYRFDVPPDRTWEIAVTPDTHPVLVIPELKLSDISPARLDLTFRPERSVRGVVVNADGRPVAGADVRVYMPSDRWEIPQETRTSKDGAFQFGGIDTTAESLKFSWFDDALDKRQWRTFDIRPGARPIEIVFGRP